MPLYKLAGNRVLTSFQNAVSGLVLTEWHSGYRAFSTDALARSSVARRRPRAVVASVSGRSRLMRSAP